jgi:hypothetical protein
VAISSQIMTDLLSDTSAGRIPDAAAITNPNSAGPARHSLTFTAIAEYTQVWFFCNTVSLMILKEGNGHAAKAKERQKPFAAPLKPRLRR